MVPMGRRLSKVSEIIKVRGTLLADTAHSRFKWFLFHTQIEFPIKSINISTKGKYKDLGPYRELIAPLSRALEKF